MSDPESVSPLWPLEEIEVAGLFGSDQSFSIGLDPEVTILTGENGSGKSTLLHGIHLLAQGHWRRFSDLPLDGMALTFVDGSRFVAHATDGGLSVSNEIDQPVVFDFESVDRLDPRRRHEIELIRRRLSTTSSPAERDLLLERASGLRRNLGFADADLIDVPDWISSFTSAFETKLISARRLEHRLRPDPARADDTAPQPVVEQYAQQLRDSMRDELSLYATESRRQEKSLPSQIVQAMQADSPEDVEELARDVDRLRQDVRELAASLARVGLFQEEDPDQQFAEYPRDDRGILLAIREVYRVTHQRLERLNTLRSDLELFANFLNTRLANKVIELNQRSGIDVVLDRSKMIRPSQLSSGEQQLLALAYELLFETKPHSIVLLDEPELSLHVAWLQGLLTSFMEMGESRALQFVVATHSPSVLAGHGDRERSLDLTAA